MEGIYEKLITTIDKSKIKTNENMGKYTSFKTGGNASFLIKLDDVKDIINILKIIKENNIPFVVIGNGSNILFRDEGFKGIVLKIESDGIYIKENKATIGAGSKNAIIARKLLENSLQGFEEISGIPGTIGGAIRMNAGAYRREIKDILETVTYIDYETLEIKTIRNNECEFSYRHSVFCENKNIIISSCFKFSKGNKEEIQTKMNELLKARKEKQPLEYPSAGSTFKRGEDFITAKLIDECGLKGYRIGGAEVSEKHAGFIINRKNASATDIINLIEYIKKAVFDKTGKIIELEIEIV